MFERYWRDETVAPETLTATAEIEAELQRRLHPSLRNQTPDRRGYMDNIPYILCADGLCMSVQTGPSHYCSPRDGVGPWSSVEVGFPSRKVGAFMEYIDGGGSDPTETVYGYVPLSKVIAAIVEAGGLMSEEAARTAFAAVAVGEG